MGNFNLPRYLASYTSIPVTTCLQPHLLEISSSSIHLTLSLLSLQFFIRLFVIRLFQPQPSSGQQVSRSLGRWSLGRWSIKYQLYPIIGIAFISHSLIIDILIPTTTTTDYLDHIISHRIEQSLLTSFKAREQLLHHFFIFSLHNLSKDLKFECPSLPLSPYN